MANACADTPVVRLAEVGHRYGDTWALREIDLAIPPGRLTGFIGPDGVGKSTLLGLIAGVRIIQQGEVQVLGGDMRRPAHRSAACERIAYMPQGLGQNLYAELSVAENVAFFGRLFNLGRTERRARMAQLLEATGLAPFADRAAGKLSGGMKQKLGLCCALIHQPDLLILDEPTTGIDPLSRQQFWELVQTMRAQSPHMSVLVASSYLGEAERFDHLVMMDAGVLLAQGAPAQLRERTRTATLDDAYIALLPEEKRRGHEAFTTPPYAARGEGAAVEARALTRRFGAFTAVDDVSFEIARGEIFGFVGPNGCGKTTTMKMVTGLLPPSQGEARLFGQVIRAGDRALRRRLGYMSQSFSLYGELSVRQNLDLHAELFDIPVPEIAPRVNALIERFGLAANADVPAEQLPLGLRQRLSLAVATIHRPDLLILDEPTSGVDPVARDVFWRLLVELSREQGTTIFVSTHYLTEATRCDRLALMNAGRILACATPQDLMAAHGARDLETAFIAYIRADEAQEEGAAVRHAQPGIGAMPAAAQGRERRGFDVRRLWALAALEARQVWRDPFRMFSAFLVPLALMFMFGYGLNVDIERIPYAVLDYDRTPQSRTYLEQFAGSRYFTTLAPAASPQEVARRLQTGELAMAVEIGAGFGKALEQGRAPEVGIWIDGTLPYYAETTLGYVELLHATYLRDLARSEVGSEPQTSPVQTQTRYWYNPGLKSKYAFVPGTLAVVLVMIPAMLTAVAVVREKELGSITNLYATPVTRLEFLWGKQFPYVAISFVNFLILALVTVAVFDVPLKGSFPALALGALLFVLASTGIGLLVSSFTRTQVAAVIVALLLTMIPSFQYSGLLSPVSGLRGGSYVFGRVFPATYYLNISVGAFTKDLGLAALLPNFFALLAIFVVLTVAGVALLKKQQA